MAASAAASAAVEAGPPTATTLFPAGGGRGQTVEITADGSFDAWPAKTWVNEPGLEIEPAAEKGKLTVRVAADAPPGIRWVRLFDEQGATAPLPFEVGTVAGLAENEPNDEPSEIQAVSPPVVIDGRLGKAGDVDGFAVPLQAGQTLVASFKGHRLGSPMDAVLQLVSPQGFVLRQTDDDVGLDPQLAFEAPGAGTYVVRCFAFPAEPDSSIRFAGSDRFVYRLTLTTGPFLDHALPLAVPEGDAEAEVEAFGWNLGDDLRRLRPEPMPSVARRRAWHPSVAQGTELLAAPQPALVEAEPGEPQPLTPPVTVSGRIEAAGDEDLYAFNATKDQVWRIRALAREFGSLLDPTLEVRSADGEVLVEADDAGESRDPDLTFTAAADGEYRISIRDLTGRGGLRFFYRLDVAESRPDFGLSIATDQATVAPGKAAELKVTVSRERGFDQPVEVVVSGLPEGVEASPLKDDGKAESADTPRRRRGRSGGDVAKSDVTLTLTAREGAATFSGPITVIGHAEHEGTALRRAALAALPAPGATTEQIWLTVPPASQ